MNSSRSLYSLSQSLIYIPIYLSVCPFILFISLLILSFSFTFFPPLFQELEKFMQRKCIGLSLTLFNLYSYLSILSLFSLSLILSLFHTFSSPLFQELKKFMQRVNCRVTNTVLRDKFKNYDSNQTGEIFFDDFCSMLQVITSCLILRFICKCLCS